MEHPHDPYHIRPFPKQPKRGGKVLVKALDDLETTLGASVPDLTRLREIQALIHEAANTFTDDKLVDMIRQMSILIDEFEKKPTKNILQKIVKQLLKVRIELKHI